MAQDAIAAIVGHAAPEGSRLLDPHLFAECVAADVLCIQELFSRQAQHFFDRLKRGGHSSAVRDHNRPHLWSRTMRGTGLGLSARSTLDVHRVVHFIAPSVGWDRLARKGVLFGQVALPGGACIDVFTTHLQAGYDLGAVAARAAQLKELATLVDQLGSPERATIVAGDFNIDGLGAAKNSPEYELLRAALPGFDDLGAREDLITYHPHPDVNELAHRCDPGGREQRIDYVFFRPASSGAVRVIAERVVRVLDAPLEATRDLRTGQRPFDKVFASDHFGLSAWFRVERA